MNMIFASNILYQQTEATSLLPLTQILLAFTSNIDANIINIWGYHIFIETPQE